jgi:translation elongation factor EF-1alpha
MSRYAISVTEFSFKNQAQVRLSTAFDADHAFNADHVFDADHVFQIAIVRFSADDVICMETFKDHPQLGRFTLRDEGIGAM